MRFIVFEGLDGSGKSSLLLALQEELTKLKMDWIRTREPGGTPLGEELRSLITRHADVPPTPRAELLLYEASRAQHVEHVIRPALQKKQWVLCDRFSASSVAFQGGGRQISTEQVEWMNDFATHSLVPDLTVLVDLSVEESKKRRAIRAIATGEKEDRIESEQDDFHERVRQSFLAQAKKNVSTWLILDSRETPDELKKKLLAHLREKKWLA